MSSALTPSAVSPDAPDGELHLTGGVPDKTLTHWQDKDRCQPVAARFVTAAGWHIPADGRHPVSGFLPPD